MVMALPFWVWAAIVAGACGALGAVAGWFAEGAGAKWGKWLTVVGIVVGLAIVRSDPFHDFIERLSVTEAQTATALNQVSPEVYAYLAEAFPEDYGKMVEATAALVRDPSMRGSVGRRSAELMQGLRHKYASFLRLAGEEELTLLMDEQIAFYELLLRDDPAICAKVAIEGPISLVDTAFGEKYVPIMQKQVVALFRAARSGIDVPVARRKSTDADWEEVSARMLAENVPDSYFQAMSTLDTTNLETCPALLAFLQAMHTTDSEGARIIRAEYLADTAGS